MENGVYYYNERCRNGGNEWRVWCHTPFFDRFVFFFTRHLISFYWVILSNFYIFISQYFISFSQHSIYLYISILSVRFANILLVFSQVCVHINLFYLSIRFTAFHCYFLIFTRFCRLRSFVASDEILAERLLWSTSFSSEGTFFLFIF